MPCWHRGSGVGGGPVERRDGVGDPGSRAAAARGLRVRPRAGARRGRGGAHRDPRRRVHRLDSRHRARRQRRGDRPERPDPDHRLPDHRGRDGVGERAFRRRRAGARGRLRSGDRLRPDPGARPARRAAARARQRARERGRRRGDRGGRRRPAPRAQGGGRVQARVRRLLGIRAGRGDLHQPAASELGRRRLHRRRRARARHRLAVRAGGARRRHGVAGQHDRADRSA